MTEHSTGHPVVHPAALSTNPALASARTDLHSAVQSVDEHRRRQYALSARDSAAAVLLEAASTRLERGYASHYFSEADAIVTGLDTPLSPLQSTPRQGDRP